MDFKLILIFAATVGGSIAFSYLNRAPNHRGFKQSFDDALTYYQAKSYEKAEETIQQAEEVARSLPKGHELHACLQLRALIQFEMGKRVEAKAALQEAVEGYGDDDDPHVKELASVCFQDLALVEQSEAEFAAADQHFQKALAIRQKLYGDASPKVANVLYSMAFFYMDMRDYKRAENAVNLYVTLIKGNKEKGERSIEYAYGVAAAGTLKTRQGELSEALKLFQKTFAIHEKSAEKDSALAAEVLDGIGLLAFRHQKYRDAENFFRKSLQSLPEPKGRDVRFVVYAHRDLALLYCIAGKLDDAQSNLDDAKKEMLRVVSESHPDYADILLIESRILELKKDNDAAAAHRAKADKILAKLSMTAETSPIAVELALAKGGAASLAPVADLKPAAASAKPTETAAAPKAPPTTKPNGKTPASATKPVANPNGAKPTASKPVAKPKFQPQPRQATPPQGAPGVKSR